MSVLSGAALSVGPFQVEAVGAVASDGLAHLVNMGRLRLPDEREQLIYIKAYTLRLLGDKIIHSHLSAS